MPKPFKAGCQRPELTIAVSEHEEVQPMSMEVKELKSVIKVGQKAPDFELAGYHKGEFSTFKLSEFLGKWVLLCFYPGDFTFV